MTQHPIQAVLIGLFLFRIITFTANKDFPHKEKKKNWTQALTQNVDYDCTCYKWRDQTETFKKLPGKWVGIKKRASVLAQNKACVRLGGKEVSVRGGAGLCGSFYSLPWVWLGFCGFSGRVTAKMQVSYVWSVCANVGRQLMHHRKKNKSFHQAPIT